MNTLVFAFGSNLDVAQMTARVPGRIIVGKARLYGYRLAFAGHSSRWNGAVATVLSESGRSVPGVIYSLDAVSLSILDGFEGRMYRRETIRVFSKGTAILCEVYMQRERSPLGAPSAKYVARIMRAYRSWGFDTRALTRSILYSAYGADALRGIEPVDEATFARRRSPTSTTTYQQSARRVESASPFASAKTLAEERLAFFRDERARGGVRVQWSEDDGDQLEIDALTIRARNHVTRQ